MNLIKKIFSGVDRQYLVKSYIISFLFTAFLVNLSSEGAGYPMPPVLLIISMVLFPFAAIVWDDLMNTLMGGHVIVLPLIFLVMWKMMKILFLFMFSILIAPIGILYIYFANGYHKKGM